MLGQSIVVLLACRLGLGKSKAALDADDLPTMTSVSSLPNATAVLSPKLTLALVVPCEHVALCDHFVLRKVLCTVLLERARVCSHTLDLEEDAVLLD